MTYYGDEAVPALSDEQWARLQAYVSAQEVESGALLWGAGEATYDLILVDSGEAEVARAATARAAEAVVARFGTGQFAGKLSLLTGQATYLRARVPKPGQVHRISPVWFRQLARHRIGQYAHFQQCARLVILALILGDLCGAGAAGRAVAIIVCVPT
jgi:CRP-like cAMP-binding protein